MSKDIWLPKTETRVSVVEGKVTVWDEMVMELKSVGKPTGFSPPKPEPPKEKK